MELDRIKSRGKIKIVTFSVSEEIVKEFNSLSKELKINKSLFIEESMKDFLKKYKER